MSRPLHHAPMKLATLGPSVPIASVHSTRDNLEWRKWYFTQAWTHPQHGLRMEVLKRDGFRCTQCGRLEPDTSKLVAHHIVPHRGDRALFWDLSNLTTVC